MDFLASFKLDNMQQNIYKKCIMLMQEKILLIDYFEKQQKVM
jgi:hypothetical protein